MPNYFSLQRKSAPDVNVPFNEIDNEIRKSLGQPPDDERYLYDWYDTIGLALALGRKLPDMVADHFWSGELHTVCCYLNEHYTSNAWARIGKW